MPFKKKTFICPYCFEEPTLATVEFCCTNPRCKNDVPDIPKTRYEMGDLNMPMKGKIHFSNPSGNAASKSALCPECNKESYKIVCPECHNALPESTLLGRDMIISIVGARGAGKSHFVGVIIHELINRISVEFGGAMERWDDTGKRYEQIFGHHLYSDLRKLDMTRSAQSADSAAFKPLIYTLRLKNKKIFGESIESFTFVFFDTAGEDLNEQVDTMSHVNKYICKSAGIIFLLDPMQISAVVHQLDKDTVKRASAHESMVTRSDEIITSVSTLIRRDRRMKDSQRINVPVAAVFSKFDAIESIIPQGTTIREPSPHCNVGHLVLQDSQNVHDEVKSLLRGWEESSFIANVETHYENHSYFVVSSLGLDNNPQGDKIQRPKPHRIEDPLLWILNKNGVVKGK